VVSARVICLIVPIVLLVVAGCGTSAPAFEDDPAPAVSFVSNVTDGAKAVEVDTLVQVQAEHGQLSDVTLQDADGADVPGEISGSDWIATERLEPGTRYTLRAHAQGADGEAAAFGVAFDTQQLTLDDQTYPAVAPLDGETVGVGMPVIVTFDIPVTDRAEFERHMFVRSEPAVTGAWSWLSDSEVHYRPKSYWPAGAEVNVFLDLNGVPAGGGIYGQQDQDIDFTIGKEVINRVDLRRHRLEHVVDGRTVKTLPISAGDARHQSRNGIKVIMEKHDSVDMDAATTGVDSSDPDYYDMKGVKWAMRLTYSGEFIHAAPWNAGYMGRANMSHGCTGLTTADAGWLYHRSRRGDVVVYVGGTRSMEDHNGWTDWNVEWDDWVSGSALPDEQTSTTRTA